jgi:hypothetical protein
VQIQILIPPLLSPTPLGESLSLLSGYEEGVQIQILILPLPPWVKDHSVCNQGMRKGCKSVGSDPKQRAKDETTKTAAIAATYELRKPGRLITSWHARATPKDRERWTEEVQENLRTGPRRGRCGRATRNG